MLVQFKILPFQYVYEGVSFLTDDQENELRKYVDSTSSNFEYRDVDERLLQEYCSKVAEWLVASTDETPLHLSIDRRMFILQFYLIKNSKLRSYY